MYAVLMLLVCILVWDNSIVELLPNLVFLCS